MYFELALRYRIASVCHFLIVMLDVTARLYQIVALAVLHE